MFPGGTEIGLEICRSLANQKQIKLFSAGTDVSNHAPFVFGAHFVLPDIFSAGWIEELNALIDEHEIQFVFPAYDDVLLALAKNQDRIRATVLTSPLTTCEITRSKSATYRHLQGVVRVPRVYAGPADVDLFPVFVKPDAGQGSQRTSLISTAEDLESHLSAHRDAIVLENLPGKEYTVDCFSDRENGLLFASGRERLRVRAGISMNSRQVHDPRFLDFARAISGQLELHGAWFFQVKETARGELVLLEIAPRVAGTSALCRVMGVNLPLLTLYESQRVPVEIAPNAMDVELDRALVNRYRHDLSFRTVYVDFDDTLIIRGSVNPELAGLLHQLANDGKKLVLVTRHAGDLPEALRRFRVQGLFDEIIHLQSNEPKSLCITDSESILIDDSFSERREVNRAHGIPTFDASMIEVLFNVRV